MRAALSLALFGLASACAEARLDAPRSSPQDQRTGKAAGAPGGRLATRSASPRIVILGDSLTAGLGLDPEDAFPAVAARKLKATGIMAEVVAAGVSGDTTASGLRRAEWTLSGEVDVLVVALGGNDGLRGVPPAETERNLDAIVALALTRNVKTLLCGMEAPPNLGPRYVADFRAVFPRVAKRHNISFLPFLLEGVAGIPELNQPDGIHPNAKGAEKVADLMVAALRPLAGSRR
jgi:acyl-CoA thioesterase-1